MRTKASDTKPKVLTNPFVSIYGVTTEEALHLGLSESDAESGLLGRFLFLHSKEARPRSQQPSVCDECQKALTVWYKAVNSQKSESDAQFESALVTVVEYSTSAKKDLGSYQQKVDEYLRSDTLNPVARAASVRIIEMIKKLALLSAVSRTPVNPIISIRDVNWAKSVTKLSRDYVANDLATAIENGGANSLESDRIIKCLNIIRNSRTYDNKNFLIATKKGYMPKRLLQNKMKVLPQTFAAIILSLIESGEICKTKLKKIEHGITGEAYYIPDDPI